MARSIISALLVIACVVQSAIAQDVVSRFKDEPQPDVKLLDLNDLIASPDTDFKWAEADLKNVNPADRQYIRYISVGYFSPESTSQLDSELSVVHNALRFWLPSLNLRRRQIKDPPLINNRLLRIDLRDYELDKNSRAEIVALAEAAGVDFGFNQAERERVINIWEAFAEKEVYYKVSVATFGIESQESGLVQIIKNTPIMDGDKKIGEAVVGASYAALSIKDGWVNIEKDKISGWVKASDVKQTSLAVQVPITAQRGWIDPVTHKVVTELTQSQVPIVRADWFLTYTSNPDPIGFYYEIMLFPKKESELFKLLGVDEKLINDNRLAQGGAVIRSIVAQHNRELQVLPSLFGADVKFVWRSLDVLDDTNDKSVIKNLAGSINRDGSELIGTNNNGTHWYYAADKDGNRVGIVPENIAQDKVAEADNSIYDTRVITAYKCVKCHGRQSGIIPFKDIISSTKDQPGVGLATILKDPKKLAFKSKVEDYYTSSLYDSISTHQGSYSKITQRTNGLTPESSSANYVQLIIRYQHYPITIAQAALEMGVKEDEARQLFLQSGDQELLVLSTGVPITRQKFEGSIHKGFNAKIYPWEREIKQ